MFTMINENTRRMVSAFAAVAVVGFGALTLDQGHLAAAPKGVVEVGELQPVALAQAPLAELPELVVTASRLQKQRAMFAGELPRLSEIVVVGQRDVAVAAADAAAEAGSRS